MNLSTYKNQAVVLTTKHGKQECIEPTFRKLLEAEIRVCSVDTDQLGTFSGDIERKDSAVECVKKKCCWGIEVTSIPYGVATEGSFGPHPSIPFIPGHHEIMGFYDKQKDFFLLESLFSMDTNYQQITTNSENELVKFSQKVFFPEHGIIVRPNSEITSALLFKGIKDTSTLMEKFEYCCQISADGLAHIETDMRAHQNPKRQQIIRQLAQKLAQRLLSLCPECKTPGYGIIDSEKGLPCLACYFATDLAKKEIWGCVKCKYRAYRARKDGLQFAPQKDCSFCNP